MPELHTPDLNLTADEIIERNNREGTWTNQPETAPLPNVQDGSRVLSSEADVLRTAISVVVQAAYKYKLIAKPSRAFFDAFLIQTLPICSGPDDAGFVPFPRKLKRQAIGEAIDHVQAAWEVSSGPSTADLQPHPKGEAYALLERVAESNAAAAGYSSPDDYREAYTDAECCGCGECLTIGSPIDRIMVRPWAEVEAERAEQAEAIRLRRMEQARLRRMEEQQADTSHFSDDDDDDDDWDDDDPNPWITADES